MSLCARRSHRRAALLRSLRWLSKFSKKTRPGFRKKQVGVLKRWVFRQCLFSIRHHEVFLLRSRSDLRIFGNTAGFDRVGSISFISTVVKLTRMTFMNNPQFHILATCSKDVALLAKAVDLCMSCSWDPGFDSHDTLSLLCQCVLHDFSCILWSWLFSKKLCSKTIWYYLLWINVQRAGRIVEPTNFLIDDSILSNRPYCQSDLNNMDYSLITKTTSSVHFTTVHANLIEQTTSSIELVVLKRRVLVVIGKDSRCLLLHRMEQHRRIMLSKETYRTLAQPADPCGNPFGDMMWKVPNPTLMIFLMVFSMNILIFSMKILNFLHEKSWGFSLWFS